MKQLVSCIVEALTTVAAVRTGYISGKGCLQAIMLR